MRNQALFKTALPFMTRLRDRFSETVGLAVLDETVPDGLIIGQVQSTQRFGFRLTPGEHFPLHAGAPGKAIVAFLPPARRSRIIRRMKFTRFNERTIASSKAFLLEIQAIVQRGYATDTAEEVEGCHCVSAPVLGRNGTAVAAIWVTGPSSRIPTSRFVSIAPSVLAAAADVSKALFEHDASQPSFMRHIIDEAGKYIEEHVTDNIEMKQLASDLHIGYSSFRHWFKTIRGIGPAQYHLQLRLTLAKKLLRTSARSIAEIGRAAGFEDQNYFSALFKKKTGLAPIAFRNKKQHRQ